jgi:replicative DNA helicase
MHCPVILLSQLSRAPELRSDKYKRPILSDLRESGAIEQDADIVLFLYRDDYYNSDSEEPNVCEVIIAKHRNGPTDTIKLTWLDKYTQFADLKWSPAIKNT